jgi:peroxiredoxin
MIDKLPSVTFKIRTTNEFENDDICFMDGENPWTDVTSEEIFGNKRVLIFSLPGAFTPTCTSQQLPGFDAIFNDLNDLGIDEIYCISVNDSFVMNAWSQKLSVKKYKTNT